jgi:hypothetical protein
MRKDSFYICLLDSNAEKKVTAIRVKGYSEGDIGLHMNSYTSKWVATYIPIGFEITTRRTRHEALRAAKEIIERTPYFEEIIR